MAVQTITISHPENYPTSITIGELNKNSNVFNGLLSNTIPSGISVENFPIVDRFVDTCIPVGETEVINVYDPNFKLDIDYRQAEVLRLARLNAIEKLPEGEIESIEFSLLKREISINFIVINNPEKFGPGSINDPGLGVVQGRDHCGTCFQDAMNCPTHFGRIPLMELSQDGNLIPAPIINPTYRREIISFLQIFCNYCGALLLSEDQILDLEKYKHAKSRIKLIEEYVKNKKKFEHSHRKGVQLECSIPGLETGTLKPCLPNPQYDLLKKVNSYKIEYKTLDGQTNERKIEDIVKIFESITPEDAKLIGLGNNMPIDFIIYDALVLPPALRGAALKEGGIDSDRMADNLIKIIKANNKLKLGVNNKGEPLKTTEIDDLKKVIYDGVRSSIENRETKSATGASQVSLYKMLKGKEGLFKGNIMANRVDFTARTVISPNPTLEFGEMSVPREWAPFLTVNVTIGQYNLEAMNKLLQERHISSVTKGSGPRKGSRIRIVDSNFDTIVLEYGDKVDRWLQDGDYLTLNRMPSLQKQSLMTGKVVLWDHRTIGIHASYTTPYNADHDGDEMNLHSPQTYGAIAEAVELMTMEMCIPNEQNNAPIIGLVMDNVNGAFLMTLEDEVMEISEWNDYLMMISYREDLGTLDQRLLDANVKKYTGKAMFSALLPASLNYINKGVVIKSGILHSGVITKDHVGPLPNSIIQALYNNPIIMDYSRRKALKRTSAFITDAARVTGAFVTNRGFTIGIRDCGLGNIELSKIKKDKLSELKALLSQMGERFTSLADKDKIENEILMATNNYRSGIGKSALDIIPEDNNFQIMITSKSKGSIHNFVQVAVSVGQQTFSGKRLPAQMTGGRRALPHFLVDDDDIAALGFVGSGFADGLTGVEFFFHAFAAREGLIHTAISISDIGVIHRNLSKMLEDNKIAYDGSVRDSNKVELQSIYGGDGFAASSLQRVVVNKGSPYEDESLSIIDIHTLAQSLNIKYGYS